VQGVYGTKQHFMMYGVFTTPVNSITGSAVCAFSLSDVLDSFEGEFKEQNYMNANWLPVPGSKVPDPRPGQCANDSRTLPDLTLNFIKSHSLMDEAVRSFYQQPIIVRTSVKWVIALFLYSVVFVFHIIILFIRTLFNSFFWFFLSVFQSHSYRFTVIAVDPQVKAIDGKTYDVLFIGTGNIKDLNIKLASKLHYTCQNLKCLIWVICYGLYIIIIFSCCRLGYTIF